MKTRSHLLLLLSATLTVWAAGAAAAVRNSAQYSVIAENVNSGGKATTSTLYQATGSIGGTGWITATAGPYTLTQGIVAQITDPAPPPNSPHLAVEMPAGIVLISSGPPIDFGSATVGAAGSPRTVTLRNTGTAPLTSIAITATGHADFALITTGLTATLAPNAQTTFQVRFTPGAEGARAATIQIASSDAASPFLLPVAGTGLAVQALNFITHPSSQFAFAGDDVEFDASAAGTPPITYQWRKGTANVTGATGQILLMENITSSRAGKYSLRATDVSGTQTSQEAFLAVVTPSLAAISVKEGTTLNLTTSVTVPTGVAVTYAWEFNGLPLSNGDRNGRVAGANSKALKITNAGEDDTGSYICRLTMTAPDGTIEGAGTETEVTVILKPIMEPLLLEDIFVAEAVDVQVTAANNPTKFAVAGLPAGMVFNKDTGRILGKATAAKVVKGVVVPYSVKFTASNAAGTSVVPLVVDWLVQPLAVGSFGTFHGLVDRQAALDGPYAKGRFGGSVKLTITSSGGVTGTLKVGGASHPITGALETPRGGGAPSGNLTVKRTTAQGGNLGMTVDIDPDTETFLGSFAGATGPSTDFNGWRMHWTSTVKPAVQRTGIFNTALVPDVAGAPSQTLPEGSGYALITVSGTGTVTLGGKLADGTSLTGGSILGPDGQVPVHLMLYTSTGSVQGVAELSEDEVAVVDGDWDWLKDQQADKVATRTYKGGIPLHTLALTGAKWVKPATGTMVMELNPGDGNAQLTFTVPELAEPLIQAVTVSSTNTAKPFGANPNTVKVTLTASSGLFSGSFIIPGATTAAKRTANYFGAIIPNLGRGAGFFLLPEPANPPTTTGTTSPMWSGPVSFDAQ